MKSLLMAMAVLVVTAVRERKSGGYNGGYYWDRGRDVFPGEGYDFSPFVTERDLWECAKRCVGHQRCTHFHQNFDNSLRPAGRPHFLLGQMRPTGQHNFLVV